MGASLDISRIFHALGDNTRRAMVEQLSKGPLTVSELAKPLDMTLAAVVQHINLLENCGLIKTWKEGRVRTCEIQTETLSAAEKWLHERRRLWERRFDRLGKLLDEE
jgi:DNA-binding transcriptional ArsR family regulator